jgi:hypothetical protein
MLVTRSVVSCAALLLVAAACNPYECLTDSRSATYAGKLGQAVAPANVAESDPGRAFLLLSEWRGSIEQQNVHASVTIAPFMTGVREVHVHAGTPTNPGRLLWRSTTGSVVGDSIWNLYGELFAGPGTWSDFWNQLDRGSAFLEVHSATGDSVTAGLRQTNADPFTHSCT